MAARPNVRRSVILIFAAALLVVGGWATRMIAQVDVGTAFEIDGDIQDFPGNGLDDWVNLNCPSIDSAHDLIKTGAVSDPPGTSIFTQGGSKDKLDINN